MIEARLPDGTVLRFPDGTPDAVIDRTVKEQMGISVAQPEAETVEPTEDVQAIPVTEGEPLTAPFTGDPGTEITEAPPLPEGALERDSALSLLASVGPRFNEGVANLVGAPVDLVNTVLGAVNVPVSDQPIGGSESIRGALEGLGVATGEEGQQRLLGRDPTLMERVVGRVSEELGATAPALAVPFTAARGAATVRPATTAQAVGRSITDPIRQAPGAVAATDVGLSTASGLGAATAQEIAPGSLGAEAAGQFAPLLAVPTVAGATRVALRGPGTQRLQQAIADFGAAGTSPSVGQATDRTSLQGLENVIGRSPGGVSRMRNVAQETAEAVGNRVNNIADGLARNADPEQAGRIVMRGLVSDGDSFATRFRDTSERLYDNLQQQIPRQQPVEVTNTTAAFNDLTSPIAGAENLSEAMVINADVRRWAQALQEDIKDTGTIPYEALSQLRSAVGRRLSDASVIADAPRGELKRIYGAITDDMEAAARAQGPEAERALERANNFYRAGIDRMESVIEPLVGRGIPEQVFTALERSGREGATTLRRVMRSLKPEERAVVSSLALRRMGRATPGQQGAEGDVFSVNTFLTNWNRISDNAKDALFSGRQQFRQDIDQIARVAERIREGSQVLANPSGTAGTAANIFGATALTGGAGLAAATGDPTLLGLALLGMGTNRAGAQLMTSPRFVRWLARGTRIPPERLPAHIARLTNTLQGSDQASEAVEALSSALGQLTDE